MNIDRRAFLNNGSSIYSFSQTVPGAEVTRRMIQLLELEPNHSVLEIGTGSGYQAACIAPLVKELVTVEVSPIPGVAEKLPSNVICYTSSKFPPIDEQFDRVVITCGVESAEPWARYVKDGGLLVAPVGSDERQELVKFRCVDGKLTKLETAAFVRFTWVEE